MSNPEGFTPAQWSAMFTASLRHEAEARERTRDELRVRLHLPTLAKLHAPRSEWGLPESMYGNDGTAR